MRFVQHARTIFTQYPEVTTVVSQVGRPDDGSDAAGFFNTEYFIDLKPRKQWRPRFSSTKDVIAAMSADLHDALPGVIWNFSQPIQDNVDEAANGVKGQLAVKLFGNDLSILEEKGEEIAKVMSQIRGIDDLGLLRVAGQPTVNLAIDGGAANRFGISITAIQEVVGIAVGGKVVGQIIEDNKRRDVVLRYQERYRTPENIGAIQMRGPSSRGVALSQLCDIKIDDAAGTIYREAGSRYIPIKYSVRGRDLTGTVEEAMRAVKEKVSLPQGYHLEWSGEYESQRRAEARLILIVPIAILALSMLIYSVLRSFAWTFTVLLTLGIAGAGGLLALFVTGSYFSVSSSAGFLALFGFSVQAGIIIVDQVNRLRASGHSVIDAAIKGGLQRLHLVLFIMSVAIVGVLPAALSNDIGTNVQRPFAIVMIGGLIANLAISPILLPALYVCFADREDKLARRSAVTVECVAASRWKSLGA
jgi:cobalt-zinc-cadmium resistance protein CzcA